MRKVCGWCRVVLDERGPVLASERDQITHGMCAECAKDPSGAAVRLWKREGKAVHFRRNVLTRSAVCGSTRSEWTSGPEDTTCPACLDELAAERARLAQLSRMRAARILDTVTEEEAFRGFEEER